MTQKKIEIHYNFDPINDQISTGHLNVCILIPTFNHEKYIKACLTSVIKQKINGKVGVIVFDDYSTDQTMSNALDVITGSTTKFEFHYVRPRYNCLSRGINWDLHILNMINSKYIALCDGDDFWSDDKKIEKQVTFLDENGDYSSCGHDSFVINSESEIIIPSLIPKNYKQDFSRAELITNECYIPTLSLMLRGNIGFPTSLGNITNGDNVIWSMLGWHGKYKLIENVSNSFYRWHRAGAWGGKSEIEQKISLGHTYMSLAKYYLTIKKSDIASIYINKALNILTEEKSSVNSWE